MPRQPGRRQGDAENVRQMIVGQHRLGRTMRHDAALAEKDEGVGGLRGQQQVVKHRDHRDAGSGQGPGFPDHRKPVAQVEAGDRLVQEQDLLGLDTASGAELRQDAGEVDALALPARQGLVEARREMADVGPRQGVRDESPRVRPVEALPDPVDAEGHHLGDAEREGEVGGLGHDGPQMGEGPGAQTSGWAGPEARSRRPWGRALRREDAGGWTCRRRSVRRSP